MSKFVMPPHPNSLAASGRDSSGRWLPGHCPNRNPPGRPVVAAEVKKLARCHGAEAIEKLVTLMRDENAPYAVQKAAADSLLDRAYGKAVQQIEAGGPGAFDDMTDDELRAYVVSKARKFIDEA